MANIGIDTTNANARSINRAQSVKGAGAADGNIFSKALVVEVINNPEEFFALLDEEDNQYAKDLKDIDVAKSAPRGSILVKAIDDQASSEINIAYPFFSSPQ